MAGITFDGIPSTETDSSIFSGTTFLGSIINMPVISGINVLVAGSVTEGQGRLRSISLGSATTPIFGGWLQAGSLVTSAGSVGFIAFGQPMSDTNYYAQVTPESISAGGSFAPWISGTKSTSGVSMVGGASTRYNWLVVGT